MTPTIPVDPTDDPLEDAVTEALAVLDGGGDAALASFLADRPSLAPRVRAALDDLRSFDLLKPIPIGLPQQLGDFRLLGVLGSGGMGVVHLAEQVSLGREVALKVVRPELLFFDGARERFRREIDAVARLEHPAIVPILATGTADGVPYYAMPRLRGVSGEALIRAWHGRAPGALRASDLVAVLAPEAGDVGIDTAAFANEPFWRVLARLVAQAASGIEHAHRRGVLHRDLKPSNLMLTTDGRAVILDFGLALARGDARLTRTGSQAGSPAYMAPEQVRGEIADERTDVYGLGAVLHALLALQTPFPSADPEVLRARILAGRRDALPESSVVPAELCLVIDTAMELDRVRRYPSAFAFAADLQAVLDGRPIQARRLPITIRVRRFALRRRGLSTAVAAAFVFVLALPSVVLWQQQRAHAELAESARRADQSVVVSIDAVERLLASVADERLRNLPAAQQVAAELLREAIALFDRLAADTQHAARVGALRNRALLRLTELAMALGRPDEAVTTARRALDILGSDALLPHGSLLRATAIRQLAATLLEVQRPEEVDGLLAAARGDLEAASSDPRLASSIARERGLLAGIDAARAIARGDVAAAEVALRAAIEQARPEAAAISDHDRVLQGVALLNLCRFLKQTERFEDALAATAAAEASVLDARGSEYGWPVPRMVVAMANHERGRIRQLQGDVGSATAAFETALGQLDEILRDYPDEPSARRLRGATAHALANIRSTASDFAAARTLAERAIADQLAVLGRNPRDAEALRFLGNHRRTLCNALRYLNDLPALEAESRVMGAMAGPPELPGAAARNLLRCAEAVPSRAVALRAEAIELLAEAARRGARIDADDPLYAPIREMPEFANVLRGGR